MYSDPEMMQQLLEETRRSNRLKQRQLAVTCVLLVALLVLATGAIALYFSLRSTLGQIAHSLADLQVLSGQLADLDLSALNSTLEELTGQIAGLDAEALNEAAGVLTQAAGNLNQFAEKIKNFSLFG